ncbi:hypothetical protein [Lacibacter sp. H407]|uniref:hypothetical protein n=1 Tax=Lacibacter sp. H407 TaxID=3133423 RepID=UPI0030BE59E5
MKKVFFSITLVIASMQLHAQTPTLTSESSRLLKTVFDCSTLAKAEYRYIFDYIKNRPGSCDVYTAMATLTMVVHETTSDVITTYTGAPLIPQLITCSKIDLTPMIVRSNTGVVTTFGGFLNPTTGRLATSLYLKSGILTTDIPLRELSATIPNGGKVFTGSIQIGNRQVTAVLTVRNQCINIGG